MSDDLVRLELLVSPGVKAQIIQQAHEANQSLAAYGGRVLSDKMKPFSEAPNSTSLLTVKLDAVIASLNSIERSIHSKK